MEFPRSLSRRNVVNPRQYYRLRFLPVGFGALLLVRDLRRQRLRELAMGCSGKMDPVPLQEIPRYHWVENNDADMTPLQLTNDGRNISGALVLRPEETEIIGARLQDDDIGLVGNIAIDAAEHAGGSITDDAGTGDRSIDAALLEDGLQSRREGIPCTNAPTHCVAGANHNNVERTGMTGRDAKDEHRRCRRSAHSGHHGLALRNATIVHSSPVIDNRLVSICELTACLRQASFGAEADMAERPLHVRFTPESRHRSEIGSPRYANFGSHLRMQFSVLTEVCQSGTLTH